MPSILHSLALLLALLYAGQAYADENEEKRHAQLAAAYTLLGIAPNASAEELKKAYRLKAMELHPDRRSGDKDAEKAFKQMRDAYDLIREARAGSGPNGEPMLLLTKKPLSPGARFGKFAARNAGEAGLFFAAVATLEYSKCVVHNEPSACKRFVESLKEGTTYGQFIAFATGAQLTSAGVLRLAGPSMWGAHAARVFGLTAGMMAAELYAEFSIHPEVAAYFAAETEEERAEHLENLYNDTFGNKTWREYKYPGIANLLTSVYAADATQRVASYARGALGSHGGRCSRLFAHFAPSLNPRGFVARRVAPLAPAVGRRFTHILLTLGWMEVLHDPIHEAWFGLLGKPEAKELAKAYQNFSATWAKGSSTDAELERLTESARDLQRRFELLRQSLLSRSNQVRLQFGEDIAFVDEQFTNIELLYRWLTDGANEQSEYWAYVQPRWFPDLQSPTDKAAQPILEKATKDFFCGPPAAASVEPERNWQGIPDPFHWDTYLQPFRVGNQAELCQRPLSERLQALTAPTRTAELDIAINEAWNAAMPAAEEIFRRYEGALAAELSLALDGAPGAAPLLLPGLAIEGAGPAAIEVRPGVVDSYKDEASLWASLAKATEDPRVQALMRRLEDETFLKADAALELQEFVRSSFEDRLPAEDFMIPPIAGEDWIEIIDNYKSYNLR